MAKKKSISISLAAKCQLLFGLAVLVIIAGALAVPWQRMEQLAGQPNVKAARFAADMLFRQLHTGGPAASAANITTQSSTSTTTQSSPPSFDPAWNDTTLIDGDYPRPRLFKTPGRNLDFPPSLAAEDPFAQQSLRMFRAKPQERETGRVATLPDGHRVYRYAAVVRLEESCLKCHGEYATWARQPRIPPAPIPATTSAPAATTTSAPASTTSAPASTVRPILTDALPPTATWPIAGVIRVDVPYQTDENQLLLNRIVIVVSGMLGGTLAIIVFYLIVTRLILQPVRVLKSTAEKVAQGDLNIRSAISTGDEFQQLSETFNQMLATLKGSQDQLESSNRSLDTRVGELAQSNVDLYEANRLKSEFLTNVTHELRTPLNAIIGFADLMVETVKEPKQQRYIENIRASAKQLLDLINDLLDLAKIEAGKVVLRQENVNVADVCEAMANFMRPLAAKKNIELGLDLAADMPLINTDPGRFQQILYNFLSNAIKFTPTDGKVVIAARKEFNETAPQKDSDDAGVVVGAPMIEAALKTAIRVSIIDSGPGIALPDQRVIFEKFRQIDGSVTRQHAGTGLGLAISRELANMLGARIELHSAPAKGAAFSIIVPVTNPEHIVDIHPTYENV